MGLAVPAVEHLLNNIPTFSIALSVISGISLMKCFCVVVTLACRRSPLAAIASFSTELTSVAIPRLSAYQPRHSRPAAASIGRTVRLARLSRFSGSPHWPRRIGPILGLPSAARSSTRRERSGLMIGTGLLDLPALNAALRIKGKSREKLGNYILDSLALIW